MVDVVTAVAETETAIETLVSVRDKVIAAYEDDHEDADLRTEIAPRERQEGVNHAGEDK